MEKNEEFEEVKIERKEKEVRTDSYFDGKLLELIGWQLLSILITGLTLGIGRPWAECMLYNYQLKHTVYNGKRLKFEGTGGDLFVNKFKWIFFTIITLGIYAFFIPVRRTKWVISNIHFEDEEFKKDESFFDGGTFALIGINLLTRLLTVCSFGILYPFMVCYKLRWINKHTVINRKKLVFAGKGLNLLGKYLLWMFLTLITFGIFGWWRKINMLKWETKNVHIKKVGEVENNSNLILFLAIPLLGISLILFFGIISTILNLIFVGFTLEDITKYPLKDTVEGWQYCEKGYRYDEYDSKCYIYNSDIDRDECQNQGFEYMYSSVHYGCVVKKDPEKQKQGFTREINHNEFPTEDIYYTETE